MFRMPQTEITSLRWALVGLSLACLVAGVRVFVGALDGFSAESIAFGILWPLLGAGLWRKSAIARAVALFVAWCLVIFVPFGIINPFMAINELGPVPPGLAELIVFWVLPWVLPALAAIHFLGKYRKQFGSAARVDA